MGKIKIFFKSIINPNREPKDSFQYVDKVERRLTDKMQQIYGGRNKELKGQTLVVWVIADSKHKLLMPCHDRLLNNLHNNNGFPIEDIVFKCETLPKDATTFFDGLAFTIVSDTIPSLRRGIISIHNGKGSMLQKEYEITVEGGRYNIGRGATGGNAIVIDANPNDSMYELNKYVRSHHAHVEYINPLGFSLFVEKDGTQVFGGSRTQIHRLSLNEPLELNNPQQPVPLQDGDVIVLGKSVELVWISR